MNFFLASLRKDLGRWRQDYLAILLWLSIPLLVGSLITALIDGDGGTKPRGILLIADQDESVLSGMLPNVFSQGTLSELITVEHTSLAEGTQKINAGVASGLLIIPQGFGNAVLNNDPATLELRTNPSQTILPAILTEVTGVLLDAGFYVRRLFGEEIDQIMAATNNDQPGELAVASIAVAIQGKIDAMAPMLFPPVIDVVVAEPPSGETDAPLALLFLPGIILMALMFAANGLAGDYWKEKETGTLRRLAFAPTASASFLAGKAAAAGLVIALIGGLALLLGFLYHDIPWSRLFSSLTWITVSGVALFAWFGALQMMAGTRRTANLLTSILLFPLLMLGGSFFPFAALPDWIAAVGRLTPNGFITDRLTHELTASAAWSIAGGSWLAVVLMAVSGLGICAWRMDSGFARG
jgi:ABC-type multidrug transport system permease subunit